MSYPLALLLTLIIELPIYAALLPRWTRVSLKRALAVGLAANLITHPLVWLMVPFAIEAGLSAIDAIAFAETFTLIGEGLFVRIGTGASIPRSVGISLIANVCSLLLGWLINDWLFAGS
jgi:hypothetical protein